MEDNKDIEVANKIAQYVHREGGTAYYVGGYVRDLILGKNNKDIDIEVHGISVESLIKILDALGERIQIGESFGIFSIKGYKLDISMPRKENLKGIGHKDFEICIDPFIGTYKASKRRDFTINSIMQNILSGEIIDQFGGIEDLKKRVIHCVDKESFKEDPLRVLRAAQFASRLNFNISDETINLCNEMDVTVLSRERVFGELEKALLKSEKPSVFFKQLRRMNKLSDWFAEVEALIGIKQNPKYHSEGDVWTHTMLVVDAAAKYKHLAKNPLAFMLSALTHDFGKIICTEEINGQIHSYNHEEAGVELVEKFLKRLTNEQKLIKYVLNMCSLHMKPNTYARDKSSVKATNKLFDKSIDAEGLIYLSLSDTLGKIPRTPIDDSESFLKKRLKIYREYMSRPYVTGKELCECGIVCKENFKHYLALSHDFRIKGVDKEEALRQILSEAKRKNDLK